MFTRFMDMHSGGGTKQAPYEYIYIEAPEAEARVIFYNRFGHSPDCVTCTCCGEDYSYGESEDLAQASGFQRGCEHEDGRYVEREAKMFAYDGYTPLEAYVQRDDVLVIYDSDILPEERTGDVPVQGYTWVD